MPTRSTLVARLDDLLAIAARASLASPADMRALGHDVLGLSSMPVTATMTGGRSTLNNDGFPLQVCFSASADGIDVRLVGDPGWRLGEPRERVEASCATLDQHIARVAPSLEPACDTLTAHVLAAAGDVTAFHHGLLWLGVGLNREGLACYCDAAPLGDEAFAVTAAWLDTLLPDTTAASHLLARLRTCAHLASLGVEGVSSRSGRAKLYWRFHHPVRLDTLDIAPLADAAVPRFLATVIGTRPMRFSGTVLSAGFDLATGRLSDAKIDLCAHCLPAEPAEWVAQLDTLCDDFALPRFPVTQELLTRQCDVAFVSLGVDVRARRRLNLYIKPPHGPRPAIRESIDAAVEYLVDLQRQDGAWVDYRLPVGESTQWITAFVGDALASSAASRVARRWVRRSSTFRAREAASHAARWLDETRSYPAGWGFNHTTGMDADSTAFALRLFRAVGRPVRPADAAALRHNWRPEGGFATYDDSDCWGAVHPCVTATGFLALDAADQRQLRASLDHYFARTVLADGTWPAYWWRAHYYSTYHHLWLHRVLGTPAPRITASRVPPEHASAFDVAYAAGIAHLAGELDTSRQLLDRLLDMQKADGGWEGDFNLRVTDPGCAEPWNDPRGALYCDYRGSITTASALMVLTGMESMHG